MSNKEAGLITTEFKKFASIAAQSGPPFDYRLQIKATIRDASGDKTLIRLISLVKQQNRLNVAGFTKREWPYSEGAPEGIRAADKVGWAAWAQTLFVNEASDISTKAGIGTRACLYRIEPHLLLDLQQYVQLHS